MNKLTFELNHGKRAIIAYANGKGSGEIPVPVLFAYISGRSRESISQRTRQMALLGDQVCH